MGEGRNQNMRIKTETIILCLLIIVASINGACGGQSNTSSEAIVFNQPPASSTLATMEDRGQVPDFSLIDQKGRSVKLADLKGHVWIADFFFTHCKGACPMMTSHMAEL